MAMSKFLSGALMVLAQQLLPSTRPSVSQAPPPGVRAGDWKYSARVEWGNRRQDLGVRTITVAPTSSQQGPSWLVVMTTQIEGQPFTDSVVMQRQDKDGYKHRANLGRHLYVVSLPNGLRLERDSASLRTIIARKSSGSLLG